MNARLARLARDQNTILAAVIVAGVIVLTISSSGGFLWLTATHAAGSTRSEPGSWPSGRDASLRAGTTRCSRGGTG